MALLAAINNATAGCPRLCSGHGTCGCGNTCTCFSGYFGGDCSLRSCPTGNAWGGKLLTGANFGVDAHSAQECSRNGLCDYSTGTCTCFPGFEGADCSRIACNKQCNGKGTCMTTRQLGEVYGQDVADVSTEGDGVGPKYGDSTDATGALIWDEYSTAACFCDYGYAGADCSEMLCPLGDNPVTVNQQRRSVTLTIDLNSASPASTEFILVHFGPAISDALIVSSASLGALTATGCIAMFESLDNVADAACVVSSSGDVYTLTASLLFDATQYHNNFFRDSGHPALSRFVCDTSHVATAAVTCGFSENDVQTLTFTKGTTSVNQLVIKISDVSTTPNKFTWSVDGTVYGPADASTSDVTLAPTDHQVKFATTIGHTLAASWSIAVLSSEVTPPGTIEHIVCGGVGRCDQNKGYCSCPTGMAGSACESQVTSTSSGSSLPLLHLYTDDKAYTGSVLRLQTLRAADDSFNFLEAMEGSNGPLFTVHGNGLVSATNVHLTNGATIAAGGINVRAGGGTIEGGLQVSGGSTLDGGITVAGGASAVTHGDATANGYWATMTHASYTGTGMRLQTTRSASSAFKFLDFYTDAGSTQMLSLMGNGLLTLHQGPLHVSTGGATISGSLNSFGGGVLDGAVMATSATTTDPAMTVRHTATSGFTNTVLKLRTPMAPASSFNLLTAATTDSDVLFSIRGDGRTTIKQGGVNIQAGGLSIGAGGQTITAGGLAIDSGATSVQGITAAGATTLQADVTLSGTTSSFLSTVSAIGLWALDSASFGTTTKTSAAGGLVHIKGADADQPVSGGLAGGSVLVQAGKGGKTGLGGHVSLLSGLSTSGDSGSVLVAGAESTYERAGLVAGHVSILGGRRAATAIGTAGDVAIAGGAATVDSAAGHVRIASGAAVNGDAGDISILGGAATGTGDGGDIVLQTGASAAAAAGRLQINDAGGGVRMTVGPTSADASVIQSPGSVTALQVHGASTSLSLASTQAVLRLTSATALATDHYLMHAATSGTTVASMTQDGDMALAGSLTGEVGTQTPSAGVFKPVSGARRSQVASSSTPAHQAAAGLSLVTNTDCGSVVFVSMDSTDGAVVKLPSAPASDSAVSCQVRVVVKAVNSAAYATNLNNFIGIRSNVAGNGNVFGAVLYESGGNVKRTVIDSVAAGVPFTEAGYGFLRLKGEVAAVGDYVDLVSLPGGTQEWYIAGGFGQWEFAIAP